MWRNWRWFFLWPFRSHRATLVVTSDQSGQKAGFWRAAPAWDGPGFHKDALTWTSVLLLNAMHIAPQSPTADPSSGSVMHLTSHHRKAHRCP